ncbi:hypothetical protein [Kibdelosporangium phytohabitans]|uniref:Uncharacterized protein n=1 Tax=Kibdelosporangium phytohabitans TaxID=860235 RepID=A0A0N9I868_9PSEU|nr:hypothetical protein [Kibdelosporangium phytohabitans]ALG12392.1 hypothetical protein AOZ06_40985 [Kibdelosporangium phytohabitans]MBE1463972.1 hypothetical protein [Kibdelosporangium phytohabitans]
MPPEHSVPTADTAAPVAAAPVTAGAAPRSPADSLLALQASAGNAAVTRMMSSPAPVAVVPPSTPEFLSLAADIEARRMAVLAHSTAQADQIRTTADASKQRYRTTADTKAVAVEQAHADALGVVQQHASTAQATIDGNLEAELARVDAAADAELQRLDRVIEEKRAAVARHADEKAAVAEQKGTEQADRADTGTAERTRRADEIATAEIERYRSHEQASEIRDTVETARRDVIAELTRTGTAVATGVRTKSAELGGHFRDEAAQTARDLDQPRTDARTQILDNRDRTKDTLREIARSATARINAEATQLGTSLRDESVRRAAEIRGQAAVFDASVDESVATTITQLTRPAEALADDLAAFVRENQDIAGYQPIVDEAHGELLAAASEREARIDELATQFLGSLDQTTGDAETTLIDYAQALTDSAQQAGADFGGPVDETMQATAQQMHDTTDEGTRSMGVVTDEVGGELDRAIRDLGTQWDRKLAEHTDELHDEVDTALRDEDRAVERFERDIEVSVDRIVEESGFFDSVWNFCAGLAEGIWNGAVALLKGVWDAVKTPLFWIAVAIVVVVLVIAVVVLVIKGAAVLAAIAAVLAFAGKVLLVIGVIVGAIAAIYYVYLAITRPDLTWRQRGELVGRAIFEAALAFTGTGILARLKVFAQISGFRALVARAGNLALAIKLVNLVPDLGKLARLLDLAEAVNVVRVLEKVRDADLALTLLGRVRDVEELMLIVDRISDVSKLPALLDLVSDTRKLGQLLERMRNPDDLITLLGEVGGPEALLRLTGDLPAADLTSLVTTHGADAVRWAATEMSGLEAQALLARMTPEVITGMRGVTPRAATRLLDAFDNSLLARVVAEIDPRDLVAFLDQQETGAARRILTQYADAGSWDRLRRFLRGTVQAAETEGYAAAGAGDLIVDNQTLSTVRAMLAGVDYSALQPIEQRMIQQLFAQLGQPLDATGTLVPPNQAALESIMGRLRAPATVMGETGVNAVHKPLGGAAADLGAVERPAGLAVDIDRNSAAYRQVLTDLESPPARPWTPSSTTAPTPVGKAEGIRDRTVVADALFAQVEGGGVPTFMTADGNVFERLAGWAVSVTPPAAGPGSAASRLARANPGGFEIIVNGRRLLVIPVGL